MTQQELYIYLENLAHLSNVDCLKGAYYNGEWIDFIVKENGCLCRLRLHITFFKSSFVMINQYDSDRFDIKYELELKDKWGNNQLFKMKQSIESRLKCKQ